MQERSSIDSVTTLKPMEKEIIRSILYFDIFKYPLTRREVFENSPLSADFKTLNEAIDSLCVDGLLKEVGEYLLAPWGDESIVSRREAGNAGAALMMPVAVEYSGKIASFPFVEGVFLSGGLSKNYFDKNSDIDYFIVTKPGRLWICRTLLILRYKLMRRERKKLWCVNYFVSSDNLAIPDMNRFTATEIAFLVPAINYPLYRRMLAANEWFREIFPNKPFLPASGQQLRKPLVSRLTEFLLGGFAGEWIDRALLSVTRRHWQRKFPALSRHEFDLQFRSRRDVCKRHTTGFQQIVLDSWMKKQSDFSSRFGIAL